MTQILCRVTRVNLQTINPTESIKLFIQILKILVTTNNTVQIQWNASPQIQKYATTTQIQ